MSTYLSNSSSINLGATCPIARQTPLYIPRTFSAASSAAPLDFPPREAGIVSIANLDVLRALGFVTVAGRPPALLSSLSLMQGYCQSVALKHLMVLPIRSSHLHFQTGVSRYD
jgi:hypothetical protein